jgi:hypothetical protein
MTIKLELLDHIATEIESIMKIQFSFEENLKVFIKWKKRTDISSSFGLEITNQFLR